MWSMDSGFDDRFPTLTVDYDVVPEPGTLLLVGSALAAAGARRLRRSSAVQSAA